MGKNWVRNGGSWAENWGFEVEKIGEVCSFELKIAFSGWFSAENRKFVTENNF